MCSRGVPRRGCLGSPPPLIAKASDKSLGSPVLIWLVGKIAEVWCNFTLVPLLSVSISIRSNRFLWESSWFCNKRLFNDRFWHSGNPRKDFDHPWSLTCCSRNTNTPTSSLLVSTDSSGMKPLLGQELWKQLEQWVPFKFSSNSLLLDIFCEIIMKQKDKITSKQQQASQRVTTSTTMHCARTGMT